MDEALVKDRSVNLNSGFLTYVPFDCCRSRDCGLRVMRHQLRSDGGAWWLEVGSGIITIRMLTHFNRLTDQG